MLNFHRKGNRRHRNISLEKSPVIDFNIKLLTKNVKLNKHSKYFAMHEPQSTDILRAVLMISGKNNKYI